jgi:hypothetical protein
MAAKGCSTGLPHVLGNPGFCEACVQAKIHRLPYHCSNFVRATRPLQIVHSDVCGPFRTKSITGKHYFVTFIDDYTRLIQVFSIVRKFDVFSCFQRYQRFVEAELNCKIGALRSDGGGEYCSGKFEEYLVASGIEHQITVPTLRSKTLSLSVPTEHSSSLLGPCS